MTRRGEKGKWLGFPVARLGSGLALPIAAFSTNPRKAPGYLCQRL
jgi:hypothetical protein